MASLLAFNLDSVQGAHVSDGIAAAPSYRRFSAAGQHVIRSIHALPKLYEDAALGDIEVYLGRAGGTPEHVLSRYRNHFNKRSHAFGVVLFSGATADVISWEGTCNRLIKRLDAGKHLCVANLVAGENGPAPSTDRAFVYMTWRLLTRRKRVGKPTPTEIEHIADAVADHASEARTADQLLTAMDPLSRPLTEYADMRCVKGRASGSWSGRASGSEEVGSAGRARSGAARRWSRDGQADPMGRRAGRGRGRDGQADPLAASGLRRRERGFR